MLKYAWDRRRPNVIRMLRRVLGPLIKRVFRLEITGAENLISHPTLYISNHNIGALIESHSILFEVDEKFDSNHIVFGFTHPSIFRLFGIKEYFEWVGAVPATFEVAREVFGSGHSVLIFPGGNQQALRSIFDYKKNAFRQSHGWAKIAKENAVDVVPITFQGSHFVNPVLFQSSLLAKTLILPWLVGLKWISVSLAQLITTAAGIYLMLHLNWNLWVIIPVSVVIFSMNSLTILLPFKIKMRIHSRIHTNYISQAELEEKVAVIMDQIYND